MEFMKEAVSLSGIINGLIVAVLFEVLRNNVKFFPSLTVVDSPKSRPVERISRTQRNREILFNIGFYFFTYMLIYFAILLPASIKANFSDTVVFLSHAKTIGFLLPDIEVTQANIQLKLALLAIVVYIPLFFIINIVTAFIIIPFIGLFYDRVQRKTKLKANGGLFIVSSIFLVAFGFTEFFNIEFKVVLFGTFFLILAVVGEATSNNTQKRS